MKRSKSARVVEVAGSAVGFPSAKLEPDERWVWESFEVVYPSLETLLQVDGIFVSYVLQAAHAGQWHDITVSLLQ